MTENQPNWLLVSYAGNWISTKRMKSVQKNKPTNAAESKKIKWQFNWVLRVGRAHPSFGRDQTELRESSRFIPNGVTNAKIGQFDHRFSRVSFRERDEDVGRLQVAMDDPKRMKLIQSRRDLVKDRKMRFVRHRKIIVTPTDEVFQCPHTKLDRQISESQNNQILVSYIFSQLFVSKINKGDTKTHTKSSSDE